MSYGYKRDWIDWTLIVGGVIAALLVLGLIASPIVYTIAAYNHDETVTCTVTGKDRSGEYSDMRVYTEECGNFAVKDALFHGHFSSSDVYADIEEGERYVLETEGFRVPFLSAFPNILDAEPVK